MLARAARRLLLWRLPSSDLRIVDTFYILAGFVVAVVVCLPILVVTTIGAYLVTLVLAAIGVNATVQGALILVLGFGGGLVLGFLVLVRISRRVPGSVRALVNDESGSESDGVAATQELTTLVAGPGAGLVVGLVVALTGSARRMSSAIRTLRTPYGRPWVDAAPAVERGSGADATTSAERLAAAAAKAPGGSSAPDETHPSPLSPDDRPTPHSGA